MPQARRRALNESVFRDVNDRIAAITVGLRKDRLEIVCECANLGCSVPIEITVARYQGVRRNPVTFIVAPGHNNPDIERVVSDRGSYLLVQKIGDAADEARETDARYRGRNGAADASSDVA